MNYKRYWILTLVDPPGSFDPPKLTVYFSTLRALKSKSQQLATSAPELDTNFDMTSNYSRGNDVNPRDILLLIKSTIPDTEARGLLKVRYLRVRVCLLVQTSY